MSRHTETDGLWSTAEVGRCLNLPRKHASALIADGELGEIVRNASGHFRVHSERVMGYTPDREALQQRFRNRRMPSEKDLFWLYD